MTKELYAALTSLLDHSPDSKELEQARIFEYEGYRAVCIYDNADGIFVGCVLGISDSLCFHDMTVEAAEERFHQSIDNYQELRLKGKQKRDDKNTINAV